MSKHSMNLIRESISRAESNGLTDEEQAQWEICSQFFSEVQDSFGRLHDNPKIGQVMAYKTLAAVIGAIIGTNAVSQSAALLVVAMLSKAILECALEASKEKSK